MPVPERCERQPRVFGCELFLAFEGFAFCFVADLGCDHLEDLPRETSQWGGRPVVSKVDQVELGPLADRQRDVVGGEVVEGVRDDVRLVEVDPPV